MSRGESGAGRRNHARRSHVARATEELVRTVAALDGPRAAELLSGLSDAVRPDALELLGRIERCSRAERHARLASAFLPRCTRSAPVDGIPGLLGAEVRKQLDPGAASSAAPGSQAIVRWARRIALEGQAVLGVTPAPAGGS